MAEEHDSDLDRVLHAQSLIDDVDPGDYDQDVAVLIDTIQNATDDLVAELLDEQA